jgi:ADP-ribosylglycohydrolase
MATLGREEYKDKVYACWLGKNCGGTLGAPLEHMFGDDEPFNIDWYPELREGGIPNDDLELQLIWLKALEERGFALTARDLAQYWLDYVGYNWDEYGMHKTSLRLGLAPPVSGSYNNWFRDCMGSPIRSEIWACLAPGAPDIAARYAYEDAIVDHAGGESVWGEMFNASLQSAAFVEQDPQVLLDIALSYIPSNSITARAIQAARQAHHDGLDWRAARERVRDAAPHYVAQYSPTNMGFQVIGWLYGADFGDALCITVNCGYDTDCTGATVGALLGILRGTAGLPERWTAPLGDTITTNESWGGVRNTSTTANPVPTTLAELTSRVCALGWRLLASRGATLQVGEATDLHSLDVRSLYAARVPAYATSSPLLLRHTLDALEVGVEYDVSPAVAPGTPRALRAHLRNTRNDPLFVDVVLTAPDDWQVEPAGREQLEIAPGASATVDYAVAVEDPAHLHNSNRLFLRVTPRDRPAEAALPVVLVGARRWLLWEAPPGTTGTTAEALDHAFPPELTAVDRLSPASIEGWHIAHGLDNALPLPPDWSGVRYARLFLHCAAPREARIGVPATCPRKLWVNGSLVHTVPNVSLLRPNYGGDHQSYVDVPLRGGWNEVLIKYARDADATAFAAHCVLAMPGPMFDGIHDLEWTRLPWERAGG